MDKWTPKQVKRLIELMEQNAFLFDIKHPDYIKRTKKQAAIAEITRQMSSIRPGLTVKIIERRIKSLRDRYRREKNKVLYSRRSGARPEEAYVPQWAFYDMLHFTCGRTDDYPSGAHGTSTSPPPLAPLDIGATITNSPSGYVYTYSPGAVCEVSHSKDSNDSMMDVTEQVKSTLAKANKTLDELIQGSLGASQKQTSLIHGFLTFLESQMSLIEHQDILQELIEDICPRVFVAINKQEARRQPATSKQTPSHPANNASSTAGPSFPSHVFKTNFANCAPVASSSPIICRISDGSEPSASVLANNKNHQKTEERNWGTRRLQCTNITSENNAEVNLGTRFELKCFNEFRGEKS